MRIVQGTIERKTTLEGQRISFVTKDVKESDKIFSTWKDKPLQVEIKPIRKGRSLNANSYMWVLCEKIAKETLGTKEDVYREAVKHVGVFHDGAFGTRDLPEVKRAWESNGVGWFIDVFDSTLVGCKRIRFYHGSSLYNTEQMSRLVDYIVEEAKALGISTETPDEIARMKQLWGVE